MGLDLDFIIALQDTITAFDLCSLHHLVENTWFVVFVWLGSWIFETELIDLKKNLVNGFNIVNIYKLSTSFYFFVFQIFQMENQWFLCDNLPSPG